MDNLFSESSSFRDNHTKLVESLQKTETISCSRLMILSRMAIDKYFEVTPSVAQDGYVRMVTDRVNDSISSRVVKVRDAMLATNEPENLEELVAESHLVTLESFRHSHRSTDIALQNILGGIEHVSVCELKENVRAYLFRVALEGASDETNDKKYDLVTELTRTESEYESPFRFGQSHKDVTYTMSFAGYEY